MLIITVFNLNEEKITELNKLDEIVEIRLDYFSLRKENIDKLAKLKTKKVFSFRRKIDGGKDLIDENERLIILKNALKLSPDFIDLEVDIDIDFYRFIKKNYPQIKIISSYHDAYKMPKNIEKFFFNEIFCKEKNKFIDYYKTVFFASSPIDGLKVLSFLKKYSKKFNLIAHSIGEKGQFTRKISKIFGSSFCYTTFEEKQNQLFLLDYFIQKNRYNYKKIDENTKIFALLGKNLDKSVSHITHNKIFKQTGKNAIYIKIEIEEKDLFLFFDIIKKEKMSFYGFSITHPYKKIIKSLAQENRSKDILNTLYRKNKNWIGENTDGIGAFNAISKNISFEKLKKIIIIGASNTAKAFLDFLFEKSIKNEKSLKYLQVILVNRSQERLLSFENQFSNLKKENKNYPKIKTILLQDIIKKDVQGYDLIINATSSVDPINDNLINDNFFEKDKYAFDFNVKPFFTPFLLKAKKKNMKLIYGIDLFIEQAKKQFFYFYKVID